MVSALKWLSLLRDMGVDAVKEKRKGDISLRPPEDPAAAPLHATAAQRLAKQPYIRKCTHMQCKSGPPVSLAKLRPLFFHCLNHIIMLAMLCP